MAKSAPFSWMNLMRPPWWEWHCCEVMSIKCRCERGARSPSHVCPGGRDMELDTDKIDEAVLALLYLGLHEGARTWKGFDWEAMNRLHEQGYITDSPRRIAESR